MVEAHELPKDVCPRCGTWGRLFLTLKPYQMAACLSCTEKAGRHVAPSIIGLVGYAGVGKTTVGKILCGLGYTPLAFADAIKAMARRLGWNGEKDAAGRRFLEEVGAAGREILGRDVWLRPVRGRIWRAKPGERFVVTDVRHPDEADEIVGTPFGMLWLIRRPGYNGNGLKSERLLETIIPARIIDNDGTLDDLERKVKAALYVA